VSGYSFTQGELIYSSYAAGTTTTPTAGAVSTIGGYPGAICVPAEYFSTLGKYTRSLRLVVGMLITATASVPTWIFGCAFTTTDAAATTPVLFTTGTYTPAAGTGAQAVMQIDIGVRAIGQGAASTIVAMGQVESPLFTASPYLMPIPAVGSAATVTSWDVEQPYYLWPYLTLGAATTGNTVTTQYVKLYGEN
jgi:hypothetical protein